MYDIGKPTDPLELTRSFRRPEPCPACKMLESVAKTIGAPPITRTCPQCQLSERLADVLRKVEEVQRTVQVLLSAGNSRELERRQFQTDIREAIAKLKKAESAKPKRRSRKAR